MPDAGIDIKLPGRWIILGRASVCKLFEPGYARIN